MRSNPILSVVANIAAVCTMFAALAIAEPIDPPSKPIDLWPDAPPGGVADKDETQNLSQRDNVLRITNVSNPTITVFSAPKAEEPAPAVIVCPGGGYHILAYNKEGTEIAEWLNRIGVTAIVLKYRVPGNRDGAFADAQRAIGLVRDNAEKWNIDPDRIGILGFSAGGHLSARLSNHRGKRTYEKVDEADDHPTAPAFNILIYPAYLADGELNIALELPIDKHTPPTFILQTQDDRKFVPGTLAYYTALTRAGVPAEMHMFQTGGHGYGLRPSNHPVSKWPEFCEKWMRSRGFIEKTERSSADSRQ